MFEHFTATRATKRSRRLYTLMGVVVGIHGLLLLSLTAKSWWEIDKLQMPREGVALAVSTPPPSPPPAKKGTPKPKTSRKSADVRKVSKPAPDLAQPLRLAEPVAMADSGDGEVGRPDGSDIGVATSDCVGPACDPNSPITDTVPPGNDDGGDGCDDPDGCQPPIIPQVAAEALLIGGDRKPKPAKVTKVAMQRAGDTRVVATVKLCISRAGAVTGPRLLKSSGYPAYDQIILAAVRGWRFKPFQVNGAAQPACTAITFIYTMR